MYINHRGKREFLIFNPSNFTLAPFSTAFLALSLDWKTGDKRSFDTYNGRNRYLIELTAVDQADIIIKGESRKAIVISPKITKLTDTETKKLRDARIYISADNSRQILKIPSDLFFGTVYTDMVDFTPEESPASGEKPEMVPAEEIHAPAAAIQKIRNQEAY